MGEQAGDGDDDDDGRWAGTAADAGDERRQ